MSRHHCLMRGLGFFNGFLLRLPVSTTFFDGALFLFQTAELTGIFGSDSLNGVVVGAHLSGEVGGLGFCFCKLLAKISNCFVDLFELGAGLIPLLIILLRLFLNLPYQLLRLLLPNLLISFNMLQVVRQTLRLRTQPLGSTRELIQHTLLLGAIVHLLLQRRQRGVHRRKARSHGLGRRLLLRIQLGNELLDRPAPPRVSLLLLGVPFDHRAQPIGGVEILLLRRDRLLRLGELALPVRVPFQLLRLPQFPHQPRPPFAQLRHPVGRRARRVGEVIQDRLHFFSRRAPAEPFLLQLAEALLLLLLGATRLFLPTSALRLGRLAFPFHPRLPFVLRFHLPSFPLVAHAPIDRGGTTVRCHLHGFPRGREGTVIGAPVAPASLERCTTARGIRTEDHPAVRTVGGDPVGGGGAVAPPHPAAAASAGLVAMKEVAKEGGLSLG
mmetsp:Transcript_23345/g.49324  ORF Transcript_23345/g.49324 Transcript_23345/m.49324 type:complete len:440 (-) Transcript_23345:12-1331(-)